MSTYVNEVSDSDLYKLKHIAGNGASESAKQTYHASGRLIFSYFLKGGGSIVIDGTRYEISDGDLFIMKPTEFFKHNIDDNSFHERIVLIIYPQILNNLPSSYSTVLSPFFNRKNGERNHIPADIVNKHRLDSVFSDLLEYSKKDIDTANVLAFSRVLEILATANDIIKAVQSSNTTDTVTKDSKVNDILRYLHANFTKDISITDVSNRFNLDRAYLSRLFKEQTGISIWDYVIMRRIYMYNFLIKDSDSIEETAYKVGFKNYSNFYRLYKKYMNMTPTEFKKSLYI